MLKQLRNKEDENKYFSKQFITSSSFKLKKGEREKENYLFKNQNKFEKKNQNKFERKLLKCFLSSNFY